MLVERSQKTKWSQSEELILRCLFFGNVVTNLGEICVNCDIYVQTPIHVYSRWPHKETMSASFMRLQQTFLSILPLVSRVSALWIYNHNNSGQNILSTRPSAPHYPRTTRETILCRTKCVLFISNYCPRR